jgi:hypothetical protein
MTLLWGEAGYMTKHKQKNDLLMALNHIERYHRRRTVLIAHAVISLGLLFLAWANWYSSYAMRGDGFTGTYFTDRLTLTVVLGLFLVGHYAITRMAEAKDVLVIKAIQQFDAEEEILESHHRRLMDEDEDDEYDSATASGSSQRAHQKQRPGI